ncbi:hypothetical protein [Candidatus Nucleicultrix amoebiphila]|jgi:hypothetical protein|uniref:Organic solvent tolerance-like N-terminal domain-containing protein n=1 Tax=Candidatus Nucleicultrix amoebiphila FS5 TaxID=1414854 RepID=A0A1W6N4Y9_9PROT|nr:hypothetical protein [Candidatus Nucleicultrix amoebiphila]ARN84839.1 hypothetical protein GQ61_05525 [Candidatus Nucleicultrix amoebiphila FS5]
MKNKNKIKVLLVSTVLFFGISLQEVHASAEHDEVERSSTGRRSPKHEIFLVVDEDVKPIGRVYVDDSQYLLLYPHLTYVAEKRIKKGKKTSTVLQNYTGLQMAGQLQQFRSSNGNRPLKRLMSVHQGVRVLYERPE